jgi:hypothetical protein
MLHDDDGADFTQANITTGNLAQGAVSVLFNASANTLANMQAAWGGGINFIPVTSWGIGFGNEGDTIAIWSSMESYNLDAPGSGRSTAHAAAVATYGASDPWPAKNDMASIFVSGLNLDPAVSGNWVRSGTAADTLGSSTANPILGTLVDHPGGDVGSPGYAPGAAVPNLLGDYNGNHVVDAADYTVWRDSLAKGGSLLNDASPGNVSQEDYNYWKSHFGATTSGGGSVAAVPEPASLTPWLLAAFVLFGRSNRVTRQKARRALR